jgi:MFS family permease
VAQGSKAEELFDAAAVTDESVRLASEPPPRGTFHLLVDPTFGSFWATKVISAIGVWTVNVVAAVATFQLTGSALMVGVVSVAQFLPLLLFGPIAGARADRGDRRHLMATGRLISAVGAGGLAVWVAAVGVEGLPGPLPVIGAAWLIGIGFAMSSSAMHAILPALVRPTELSTAIALDNTPYTIARAVGPAVGALILGVAGPAPVWAFAAVAFLLHAVVGLRLRLRPTANSAAGDKSVRAGLRHLRTDPACALLLVGVLAIGLGIDPVLTLTPALAAELGGGDSLVGWMVSAFGLGSAVVIVTMTPVRRWLGLRRMNPIGLLTFAGAYAALAVIPRAGFSLVAFFVAGAGMMLAIPSLTTQLQSRLPEELRGRVMSLWVVAYLGSRPVAAALNGAITDVFSVEAALAVMSGILVAGAVIARPSRTDVPVPVAK